MTQHEEISRLFDYDRWANLRWLEPAQALGLSPILVHIVDAQVIWWSRIEGHPRWAPSIETLASDLDRSIQNWQRLLANRDLNRPVTYTNFQGNTHTQSVGEIIRHVINHGTYHRGELRGRAGERGYEGFEDTDYILFCREGF